MSDRPYKRGDVANGHVLGADNQWHPIQPQVPVTKQGMSRGKKIAIGAGSGFAALLLLGAIAGPPPEEGTPAAAEQEDEREPINAASDPKPLPAPSVDPTPTLVVEDEPAPTPAPEQPKTTLAQRNALRSAESYLEFTHFSRQGLIDQLSSEYGEGYEMADAIWAVDNVAADWNAEAVEAADSYLEFSSFSRQGLFDQLTSEYGEQFTAEQANHALAAVGY